VVYDRLHKLLKFLFWLTLAWIPTQMGELTNTIRNQLNLLN